MFLKNNSIYYTAGDTFKRVVTPEISEEGSRLRFQVAAIEGGEAFINHTYSLNSDNEYDVVLSDSDTAKLLAGNDYVYRATQISITGEIITKISGHFIVTWGVNADSNKDISIGMTPENKLKAMINSESEQREKNDIELRDMIREKVDKTGISNLVDKSLYYYGDSSIIPADEKYFNITKYGVISRNLDVWDDKITNLIIPFEINGIKVKVIDSGAFADRASITSVTIPNGVTFLDGGAFAYCTSLKTIYIPESIEEICDAAFSNCTALENVYYRGSKSQWDTIKIGTIDDSNISLLNARITYEGNLATEKYVDDLKDKVDDCTSRLNELGSRVSSNEAEIEVLKQTGGGSVKIMDTDEFIELWNNTSDFELFAGKATEAKTMAVYLGQINANTNHLNDLYERKSDKTTISTSSDTAYIFDLLDNYNKEIRLTAVLSSISFNIPTKPKDDYISSLSFSTGDVTIPIDYPSGGIINWVGTDCSISDGISNFIPSPNKHYDIVFYYNGTSMVGMVNGFVPAEVIS